MRLADGTYAKSSVRLQDGTYHRDVYFPFPSQIDVVGPLRWSRHALERAMEKGIVHPTLGLMDLIEVTVESGRPVKVLVRGNYSETEDVVLVLIGQYVKTAWKNRIADKHRTLDRSRYVNCA